MKYYTIYKITHIPSGKFYIGRHVTSNLDDSYMGSGKYITAAIEKYGIDQFEKSYLYIFYDPYFMYLHEEAIVTKEFCGCNSNYNIAPGGFSGGFQYINSNKLRNGFESNDYNGTIDHRKNAKVSMTHINLSGKGYRGGSTGNFAGHKHSDKTKLKIGLKSSYHQAGVRNSQYGLRWITNGVICKKINQYEILPDGWKYGRK